MNDQIERGKKGTQIEISRRSRQMEGTGMKKTWTSRILPAQKKMDC